MSTLEKAYGNTSPIARIGIVLALASLFAWYYWDDLVVPQETILQAKQEELEKITNELKNSNFLISLLAMEEELNNANREYIKLMELLPDEPAIEKVLNEFAGISRITGVEIREFMPSTTNPSGGSTGTDPGTSPTTSAGANSSAIEETRSVAISLKLLGTFNSLLSFVDVALSLPRIIHVREFEFANEESQLKIIQRPKLSFKATFDAYFQSPNTKAATKAVLTQPSSSKDISAQKPLVDVNQFIEKNFSAKGNKEP